MEFYLREQSRLPGPRANLELANDVGYLLAAAIDKQPDTVYTLINYFATGDRKQVVGNTPDEFIMLCGVIAAGACAAAHPAWREKTIEMLSHYACSPYWRIREGVATAYQHLLNADQQIVIDSLKRMATDGNYLQQRAAIASVAEPRLLFDAEIVNNAVELQRIVLENARRVPVAERKVEDFKVLRRALGYTLSVITAAAPERGFALMRECATWNDDDVTWILRENLKKKRLAKFSKDTALVAQLLA
ncbi:MAG: hypothetical protein NVS2B12_34590 [Ktedonobacteraceae bacterium]